MKNGVWSTALLALTIGLGAARLATAAGPGGEVGRGGAPSFDTLLDAFDGDDNSELMEEEVPVPVWRRLSNADADGNGSATREEFEAARKSRGGK